MAGSLRDEDTFSEVGRPSARDRVVRSLPAPSGSVFPDRSISDLEPEEQLEGPDEDRREVTRREQGDRRQKFPEDSSPQEPRGQVQATDTGQAAPSVELESDCVLHGDDVLRAQGVCHSATPGVFGQNPLKERGLRAVILLSDVGVHRDFLSL